jgi:hypothetical protein
MVQAKQGYRHDVNLIKEYRLFGGQGCRHAPLPFSLWSGRVAGGVSRRWYTIYMHTQCHSNIDSRMHISPVHCSHDTIIV